MIYSMDNIRFSREGFTLSVDRLTISRGERYAVVGPNGSGKSSLMLLLALLQRPDSGSLIFNGMPASYDKTGAGTISMRQRIGVLLQQPYLFKTSVHANVESGLKLRRIPASGREPMCRDIMERLGISHLAGRHVRSLSGGEYQRVALARSLVLDADVYLLDEPTTSIDAQHITCVEQTVRSIAEDRGAAVVFTTHIKDQALRLADHQISIIDGSIHDLPYENIFTGTGVPAGANRVNIGNVSVHTACPVSPDATLAIDPTDIILSRKPLDSSALNSFHGRVQKIERHTDSSVQVFIDAGVLFCARITAMSMKTLNITIGTPVWATFKATAVHVISYNNRGK